MHSRVGDRTHDRPMVSSRHREDRELSFLAVDMILQRLPELIERDRALHKRGLGMNVTQRLDLKCPSHLFRGKAVTEAETHSLWLTEDQIIGVLREHEAGVKTAELCRKHGISDATFYNWKAKYGGMTVSEAARLRTLEDENRRLKRLLAESMLDVSALKDLLGKN